MQAQRRKRIELLTNEIKSAFAKTPRPRDLDLPQDEGENGAEMERVLGNRNWWDVDVRELSSSIGVSLGTLTIEAALYYLPAFLLAAIDKQFDGTSTGRYLQARPWKVDGWDFTKWLKDQLDQQQRQAVLSLIRFEYEFFPDEFKYEYCDETLAFWSDESEGSV